MPKENYSFGYYLVGFLDLLGQKQKLTRLRHLPTNAAELEQAKKILSETAGAVLKLRDLFERFTNNYQQVGAIVKTLPQEAQEKIQAARLSYQCRGFSDSLIITVKLATEDEQFTQMTGAFGTVVGCCMAQLLSLAMGSPVRGGIEVGVGMDITDDEIYGAANYEAYRLEQECAKYPRVLIGDELWNYLNAVESQPLSTPYSKIAAKLATMTKGYICEDSDGLRITDFLGRAVAKDTAVLAEDNLEVIRRIDKFVESMEQNYKADDKIGSKYGMLRNYLNKRRYLWP